MDDELRRRERLCAHAMSTGHEYTWQDVKELVDIADLAIDQQIRKTFRINGWSKLADKFVGLDRSWVEFEAERQVWKLVGKSNKNELAELTLTIRMQHPHVKNTPSQSHSYPIGGRMSELKLQTVMNWYGSIGGCINGGGVSYVTFVRPLRHGDQVNHGCVAQMASGQLPPEGLKSSTSTFSGLSTTKIAPAAATTQNSTSGPHAVRWQSKFPRSHFQKDVTPYICRSMDKEEYIGPVERKFVYRVEGSEEDTSLKLWAQPWQTGGLVDDGVIACGVFLKSYEHEVRYNSSQGPKGPRIDNFLEFYLCDDFTTVEQRTAADLDHLHHRTLGINSNTSPEMINEVPNAVFVPATVTGQVTGQVLPLQDFLKVHEGRIKKTYKKELLAENSRFMKRIEAKMWDKWCDEYGYDAAPRSSPASKSRAIRQEAEEVLPQSSESLTDIVKVEKMGD
ncbi:hypothetical protein DL95DRAFT_405009 [Leptodontidium sp. 2 PMI_412]|nr:hypothetical protein DL95DRAFT_405009 [Leptodontidium sp. 2 PMI_412]